MRNFIKWMHHKFCKQKKSSVSAYQPLSPKDDMDYENNEYFKAMDYALNQPKIKNIALAGPYGSGKVV